MDPARRRYVEQLYATGKAHDDALADRLERFRNLEPPTAALLGLLVRATGASRLLELGTSNGYSTIWLADAAEATGGRVVSVEIDPARASLARENLSDVGLAEVAELRVADAQDVLGSSGDGAWDLIFLDAERPAYAAYLPDLVRTLAPGGLLAVDNVISHEQELVAFTALIEAEPDLTQVIAPIGAGLRLAVRGARPGSAA